MNPPVPPAPPGWNKTFADLFAELDRGERSSIGFPETEWARAYERSLIPEGMRFPRKGDVYEVLEDMPVRFLTSWAAPYTGSGEGLLRKGDRVLVDQDPSDGQAISTYAIAVNPAALESRLVPAADRASPKYTGFYFSFQTVDLNRRFRLVHAESP